MLVFNKQYKTFWSLSVLLSKFSVQTQPKILIFYERYKFPTSVFIDFIPNVGEMWWIIYQTDKLNENCGSGVVSKK